MIEVSKKEETKIVIRVANKNAECFIESDISVLYCCHCDKQSHHFYKFEQSDRAAFAGIVSCSFCEAKIKVLFPGFTSNIIHQVTYFKETPIAVYKIDIGEMYQLNNDIWHLLKEKKHFDIFELYNGKHLLLSELIQKIQSKHQIVLQEDKQYYFEAIKLPSIISKWYELLEQITNISSEKKP